MKKLISLFIILFVSFGLMMSDAEAGRFGGGRSFGVSRATSSFSRARPATAPFQDMRNRSQGNRWLGPLAGLAIGTMLGSLFMGNGLASGMMSWLLLGGVILLLMNLFRGFSRNKMQMNQGQSAYSFQRDNFAQNAPIDSVSYPSGFNEDDFLRDAKVQFIRLQAAFDQKNLQDLSSFTTPEVFAEIKLQLQERGDKNNQTDVVSLNAELLDVSAQYQQTEASVKFSGLIKEEVGQAATPFTEIWHFRKSNGIWLTAGVQQNS